MVDVVEVVPVIVVVYGLMTASMYTSAGLEAPRLSRGVKALLIANAAVFVCQLLLGVEAQPMLIQLFGLTRDVVLKLRIWQIVTYMFLHGGVGHLFWNMLLLFFLGPETERSLGTKRFIYVYMGCGVLAGVGWLLLTGWGGELPCIGASGAVFGVLGAFAALFPNRRVALLFPPVVLSARLLAIILGLFAFVSLLDRSGGGIAHAAHLAGGLAGYVFIRELMKVGGLGGYGGATSGPPNRLGAWFRHVVARWRRGTFRSVPGGKSTAPSQPEVDAVLDKLAKDGWEALTKKDRDILDRASKS